MLQLPEWAIDGTRRGGVPIAHLEGVSGLDCAPTRKERALATVRDAPLRSLGQGFVSVP